MLYPWEMSILDGAHALWLRAKLSIVGDTAITGDLDVSGAITGGTIPIENLSDVEDQSFVNLLDNGDFKLWPAGDSSAPGGWALAGAGAGVALEATEIKTGLYSAKITYGSAAAFLQNTDFNDTVFVNDLKGKTITAVCWAKTSAAGVGRIIIVDDSSTTSSSYHTGSDNWELLTVTKTIDASTTNITIKIRTESAGFVYFDSVMIVEGSICPAFSPKPLTGAPTYGEMYIYNNSNVTVIETADTPIALRQISEGLNSGFIFHAGSTGAITAYADYSGTVAGTVLVTDVGHGLATGDIITIRGSTNYNGIFAVTVVSVDTFYITDTWVADDGASDWDQGASLTAQPGAAGIYTSTWQMTTAPAGACRVLFKANINITPQDKSSAGRELAINDEDNNSSTCLLDVSEGDIIWLSAQSDATTDITNGYGNINIERIR